MSNAERQRNFRKRNPGYYGRLHARRRSGIRASLAAQAAAEMAAPAPAAVLMLPAPVEMILIPGMNVIPQSLDAMREMAVLISEKR
jgi:hypothetical protein